jgi:hypothetical protein
LLPICCLLLLGKTAAAAAVLGDGSSSVAGSSLLGQTIKQEQQQHYYDFDKLNSLIKRLAVLEKAAPEMLLSFYDRKLQSFSAQPGNRNKAGRLCITSTCYMLLTLALSSDRYQSIVLWDDVAATTSSSRSTADETKIPMRQVMRNLLAAKWRDDDLFQVPLLIYTILRVDSDRSLLRHVAAQDKATALRIQTLISSVLKGRPHRKLGTRQIHSDYIIYQVCKVLALLQQQQPPPSAETEGNFDETDSSSSKADTSVEDETVNKTEYGVGGLPLTALPEGASSEVFWGLLRCAEVSSNELCRQLSYRLAGDLNSFDVIRLAYSLLTYLRSTESLSGIAGREVEPGQGPSPETRVAPLNKKLVAAALAAFFQEQGNDGLWDKGQPIYKSFKEGQGRNMGGAFVFSVNTVGSLLCALPAEDFRPHLGALERTLKWIESHQTLEIISDYTDPKTGQCFGKPLRGWTSPHLSIPDAGPKAWSTAQVLKCVSWMSKTIRELMHNDVLEEFHGIKFSQEGIQKESWDRLLDTDLGAPPPPSAAAAAAVAASFSSNSSNSTQGYRTLKSVLEERVITPFEKSFDNPSYGAAYSAILFGPPGTAKTS